MKEPTELIKRLPQNKSYSSILALFPALFFFFGGGDKVDYAIMYTLYMYV